MRDIPKKSEARPRPNLRRLAQVVGGTVAVASALLICVIVYTGIKANRTEVQAERARIENALNQSVARTLDQQKSVAWWDDAVRLIVDTPDLGFIDSNFGIFLTETYGHDEVYIVDSQNQPVYAYRDQGRQEPDAFEARRQEVLQVLTATRTGGNAGLAERDDFFSERQKHYEVLKKVLGVASWQGAILTVDEKPAIVTAITIVPNVDMTLLRQPPYVLLSVDWIDADFLQQLSQFLLIPDITFTAAESTGAATISEAFVTDDNRSTGYLNWTTKRPGQPLLTIVLPLVAVAVIGLSLLCAVMLRRLIRASNELSAREAAARYEAAHDSLSKLPNRPAFVFAANQALDGLQERGRGGSMTIGYLDVDRFKDINDTLGHHIGDGLIKAFGERLRQHLGPHDFLARFGGDEFAIFRSRKGVSFAKPLASLVVEAFEQPLLIEGHEITVTASLGLAQFPEHGTSIEDLMRHADIALYEAKRLGRGHAAWFTTQMAASLRQKREIEMDLLEALNGEQFDLHYQPIISARSNRIVAVEALLRWKHPVKGMISPSVFIPIAEEIGLMSKLGDWVLKRAMTSAALWPDIEVTINLSPAQFYQSDLEIRLQELIAETGVSPTMVTLEITEGLLLEPSPRIMATLQAIRDLGFQIALDDFGTGFSSLSYLVEYRFDKLKIDRSFVSAISQAGSAQTVVQAVIRLGHALGMEVVAEGVETVTDSVTMRFWGSDHLQGYFFSRPLPADELIAFIGSYNSSSVALQFDEASNLLQSNGSLG